MYQNWMALGHLFPKSLREPVTCRSNAETGKTIHKRYTGLAVNEVNRGIKNTSNARRLTIRVKLAVKHLA